MIEEKPDFFHEHHDFPEREIQFFLLRPTEKVIKHINTIEFKMSS